MHQVKLSLFNDRLMDLLTMGSRSISPSGYGAFIQPEGVHNGLDWASIRQKRYHDDDQIHWFTQPLKHGSSTGTKRLFTDFTAIALPFPIVDHDGTLILLASCRTRHIRAKCFRRVHWLWVCLHKPQYAYGRLFFQALLLLSPDSDIVGEFKNQARFELEFVVFPSVKTEFANNILMGLYPFKKFHGKRGIS